MAALGMAQTGDEKPPPKIEATVEDIDRLIELPEGGRLSAEEAAPPPPKYNTNCSAAFYLLSSDVLGGFRISARAELLFGRSKKSGNSFVWPYYIVDEDGNLPRLLGSSSAAEESVVLSRAFPGNLLYEFLPPMDFRAGKSYKIVMFGDLSQSVDSLHSLCAGGAVPKWKEFDLPSEVVERACREGRFELRRELFENVVIHEASEAEEAQHRALANQWEFPIAGEGEVFAASVPPPTMLHVPDSPAAHSRSGIIPVIFGDGKIHAVRAYHRTEDERRLLFSFPCTPTSPGKSGETAIRPPRRTAYFHLLLRKPGRHLGEDGRDSAMLGWELCGPYSLETKDGCHPEDVDVPVQGAGRPISAEDMRAFQRGGSFPIELRYE